MTQDEIAKLIPDNVVDMLADQFAASKHQLRLRFLSEYAQSSLRNKARSSLAAGLAAWGGMQHRTWTPVMPGAQIILPIQERSP